MEVSNMNYKFLFPAFKKYAVTFSYDDGVKQDIKLISLLRKYGFRGTFNLNSSKGGSEKIRKDIYDKDVDCAILPFNEDSLELYKGMEVASHTFTHPFMQYLSYEEQFEEYRKDIKFLEDFFKTKIHGGAYPFGTYNKDSLLAQQALGLEYSRTTKSSYSFNRPYNFLTWNPTIHHNDPRIYELFKKFFKCEDELPVFYVWGHAYEFDLQHNWEIIDKLGEIASKHSDEIWNATNYELCYYYKQTDLVYYYLDRRIQKRVFYSDADIDIYLETENGDKIVVPKKGTVIYE